MYEQDTDAIIQGIIEKLKTEHVVSISAVVAEIKGIRLLDVEWTEEKGITNDELRNIKAKIIARYKNKYLFEIVEHPKTAGAPSYVEYFVSKNPNYNRYNLFTKIAKHPVWTLIGIAIAAVALFWQIRDSNKNENVKTKPDSTITPAQKVPPINSDTALKRRSNDSTK